MHVQPALTRRGFIRLAGVAGVVGAVGILGACEAIRLPGSGATPAA